MFQGLCFVWTGGSARPRVKQRALACGIGPVGRQLARGAGLATCGAFALKATLKLEPHQSTGLNYAVSPFCSVRGRNMQRVLRGTAWYKKRKLTLNSPFRSVQKHLPGTRRQVPVCKRGGSVWISPSSSPPGKGRFWSALIQIYNELPYKIFYAALAARLGCEPRCSESPSPTRRRARGLRILSSMHPTSCQPPGPLPKVPQATAGGPGGPLSELEAGC